MCFFKKGNLQESCVTAVPGGEAANVDGANIWPRRRIYKSDADQCIMMDGAAALFYLPRKLALGSQHSYPQRQRAYTAVMSTRALALALALPVAWSQQMGACQIELQRIQSSGINLASPPLSFDRATRTRHKPSS